MKRSLLAAAAALLISTATASAYDMSCDAPVTALGDTRDNNPVVSTFIQYFPENHQWRVIHYLANGLMVLRAVQYDMRDATNDHRVQWQGPLVRNRSLYMIGELRRVESGVVYMEWIYDRAKGNTLLMQSTARCEQVMPPALPQPTS
jgi:hypothetical protein